METTTPACPGGCCVGVMDPTLNGPVGSHIRPMYQVINDNGHIMSPYWDRHGDGVRWPAPDRDSRWAL